MKQPPHYSNLRGPNMTFKPYPGEHYVRITNHSIIQRELSFLLDEYNLTPEVLDWLKDNAKGRYIFTEYKEFGVRFELKEDALRFKLTWA